MASVPSLPLLGLDFSALVLEDTVRLIDNRPIGAGFAYVVTPNADHFVRLARSPDLLSAYHGAWLRLLDSRVVATAARLLGLATPPLVPGSDLTEGLLARLPAGERIAVVGMRPAAVQALAARHGLAPPFHHDPPMGFDADAREVSRAVRFVCDHPARLIFLAVGSPRQERLAAAIADQCCATGTALCIGASLDYLAGAARRAPRWMRRASLEWLHRLATDPRRLAGRYLRDDPAIFRLLLQERRRLTPRIPPPLAGGG